MLGWLTRLFGKRAQTESAPQPPPAPAAAPDSGRSQGAGSPSAPELKEVAPPALAAIETATAATETREVCPTCGKTSVFAGPPGHRYCMHCALRQELFDASAAANH